MASFVFQINYAQIDSVEVDCSINETHSADSEVTQHPVEEGADITDHVRAKPLMLAMEGVVTDANPGNPSPGRWRDAYDKLMSLRNKGSPFTLVTALKIYQDMVFVGLSFPRDMAGTDSLRFSATLQQIKRVTSQTVKLPKVDLDKLKPKVDKNKKAAATATEPPAKPEAFLREGVRTLAGDTQQ